AERQRSAQPQRHGLPVREMPISRRGLQRMADGMAEIEERALTALALVGGDDARLEPDRSLDQRSQGAGIAGGGALQVAFAARQQISSFEQGALHHFRETTPALALR